MSHFSNSQFFQPAFINVLCWWA